MAKVDPQTALGETSNSFIDSITCIYFAPHKNVSSVLRIFGCFPPVKLSQTLLISSQQSGDLGLIEGSLYLMMLIHDNSKLIMMMMSREEEGLVGPWVAVGGSYPGSLAGWLRLRFPVLMMFNDSSCTICVFISKIS